MAIDLVKARDIFNVAVEELDPAAKHSFLDEACGADKELRQHVDRLLGAHDQSTSFLDLGAVATLVAEYPMSEQPGTDIGPYKLLEQIGEGGFGVVFLAEQATPIRRRVALKIVKPGMDTRQVLARFEAERQALALMDHPGIAKVFDAGVTEQGRSYFVMELVQGVPINEYCDECQLPTRERLELFIAVCQAVQHAHQKGIIHRDLKPTNVLVALQDGRPVPKIIDFGVAKAIEQRLTEQTLTTAFAQMVGTPLYMSPEQAELSPLGVDTRTDIYSLGVLLYELLTGTTPFDKDRIHAASYDELRRIIREEEPPRPSTRFTTLAAGEATTIAEHRRTEPRRLGQQVRGELDWIVMKCLEKDRARRYETVSGLAHDVERHLRAEPVEACPPSRTYRVFKFILRNRIPVAATALVFASMFVATCVSSYLYFREREALRQAEFGAKIHDIAISVRGSDLQTADKTLRTMQPLVSQMNARNLARWHYLVADLRARQLLWREAADNLLAGITLESEQLNFEPWRFYLPLLLQCGDVDSYDLARQQALFLFGRTTDTRRAEILLRDCLLRPWPNADLAALERLADLPPDPNYPWSRASYKFSKGLLAFRNQEYRQAIELASDAAVPGEHSWLRINANMLLAMSQHQVGNAAAADELLTHGLSLSVALPRDNQLYGELRWNDLIVTRLLVDEARGLIDPKRSVALSGALVDADRTNKSVATLFSLALERLHANDQDGYQQACRDLNRLPLDTGDSEAGIRRLWAACLGPNSRADLRVPFTLAESAAINHTLDFEYLEQLLLGGVLHRLGRNAEAVQHLETAIAAYPRRPPTYHGSVLYPQLLLVMSQWQLGRGDEARRLWERILPTIRNTLASRNTHWTFRATVEVLYREAASMIRPKGADQATGDTSQLSPSGATVMPSPTDF